MQTVRQLHHAFLKRNVALAIGVSLAAIFLAYAVTVQRRVRNIEYLFHYELTDAQIAALPAEISGIALKIKTRTMDVIDSDTLDQLSRDCPHRSMGEHKIRLLWALDGTRPDEGERCLLIDLDANDRRVSLCGFVIVG